MKRKVNSSNKPANATAMRSLLAAVLVLLLAPLHAQTSTAGNSEVASINAEQWELARGGEKVASLDALSEFILRWTRNSNGRIIEIQYPGGEEGELWVNELTGWLVSLGIPSSSLLTVPGSGQADLVRFKIINGGVVYQ